MSASALSEDDKANTLEQVMTEVEKVKNLTEANVNSSGPIFG